MAARLFCACMLAVLILLRPLAAAIPSPPVRGATHTANWQVVLAAGDGSLPVFDDATAAFARRLVMAGVPRADIHRLTASAAELRAGVAPATRDRLLRRIADLPARPGDRCLVFLTSHGERGAGLWLALSDAALSPEQLARALSGGCAAVPTVVIVSGCYTGAFAEGAMRRPNRIILTAARADRPSFGCQAGRTYTFFDQCLLAALPQSASWRGAFARTARCVRWMEDRLDMQPSDPQAYFGAAVGALSLGF
ncbi:MAG TPA: C13 family peptidase [Stellaceae bacterium]|nr:C13 family peptidase [Stellaceae bacterium]